MLVGQPNATHQRDHIGGVLCEFVRQLLVVGDEVGNVDVAVVLLDEHIFADLVSGAEVSCGEGEGGRPTCR